jgi:hypothetical protein
VLQKGLLLPVISLWLVAEVSRLYLGFKGNLGERVGNNLSRDI